jgi:hypothetical protein
MSRRRKTSIDGQFVAHRLAMIESDAWRALTLPARRVLDRLEIEHAHHGGMENGALICTFDDFARAGVRRQSVARAIRDLEKLGFIEVTQRGRRAAGEFYLPSRYRLTYLHTKTGGPTDEWRRVSGQIVAELQNRNPGAKMHPAPGSRLHLKSRNSRCENASTVSGANMHPPSISRVRDGAEGGGERSALPQGAVASSPPSSAKSNFSEQGDGEVPVHRGPIQISEALRANLLRRTAGKWR